MRRCVAVALAVCLLSGCDTSVSPSNATRYQSNSSGVVTAHKRYGAKSTWLQVDRAGEKTWGKVTRRAYRRCANGDKWPACKEAAK